MTGIALRMLLATGWAATFGAVALDHPRAALGSATTEPAGGVVITGGRNASGGYQWAVKNEYTSPIVYIQFPHYHADTFIAPEGWEKESTYLVNKGVADRPGTCTAYVDDPRASIRPNQSAQFGMRIARVDARRGTGDVLVRFADGTTTTVTGVELPCTFPAAPRYATVLGLAALMLILVLVEVRRRRRAQRATTPAAGGPSPAS